MKNISIVLILVCILLTGCSNSEKAISENESVKPVDSIDASKNDESEQQAAAISVDEGIFDVKVSLSLDFMKTLDEDFDIEQYKQENSTFKDVKVEGDNIIITMTKTEHQKQLNEMASTIDESIADILTGEETANAFVSIIRNFDCSELTVEINNSETNLMQEIYLLGIRIQCLFYQMFMEDGSTTIKTTVINVSTGDIVYSTDYPNFE